MVDESGLAVAVTSTVNLYFGSLVMAGGIVLNDEMDDFSSPDRSNSFGYPPSVPNFIAPGKRPLSSMTPTIAERNGKLRLVLGGSGGSRIITGVIQVHTLLALFCILIFLRCCFSL
jgi:gamma-glutamyltranspeptidase